VSRDAAWDVITGLCILALLCGNGLVSGIDVGLVLLLFLATIAPLFAQKISSVIHVSLLFGFLIGLVFVGLTIEKEFFYFDNYYLWPIKAILGSTILILAWKGGQIPLESAILLSWIIGLGAFLMLALIFGEVRFGRLYFVFGPNMLYRLACIVLGLIFVASVASRPTKLTIMLSVIFGTGAVLVILNAGSRGAIVVLGVISLYICRHIFLSLYSWVYVIAIGGAIAYVISLNMDNRIFIAFQTDSLLNSGRFDFVRYTGQTPFTVLGNNYEAFLPMAGMHFRYPHNIFLELYFFYGVLGLFVSGLVCFAFLRIANDRSMFTNNPVVSIVFIVGVTSACMSGDLSDNYFVIALAVASLLARSGRLLHQRPA
jgi:hypothetical protein